MNKNLESDPFFFSSQEEWRTWLDENFDKTEEIWIGFYKSGSGIKGITNKEAVDEALCFGWIDGLVKGRDETTWIKRFTPRKPSSIWSLANTRRVQELTEMGKMHSAGLKAFSLRTQKRSGIYSFESEAKEFSGEFLKIFVSNPEAWQNFSAMPPSYRKTATHWVLTAKQQATREGRLDQLIKVSRQNKRLPHLSRPNKS